MAVEILVELHRIIEMKDGAVFKTKFIANVWVPHGEKPPPGYQHVNKSNSYEGQTIRSVPDK